MIEEPLSTQSGKPPLTAGELVRRLTLLFGEKPEASDYPVHLMVMDDNSDSLLTTIELDSFDPDTVEMVVSLIGDTTGKLHNV